MYIDFEGPKGKSPAFLGVHRKGDHVQPDIVDPSLASLGPSRTLRDAVTHIIVRAESRNRRLVSWSEHDLDVVRTLTESEDPALVERFERRYANARAIAERWRNAVHGGNKPDVGRLADYLPLVGYAVPDGAEGGDVGQVISDIRDRIDRGLDPTPGQLARWDRLIEHNWHDCVGMREVCIRATRELEALARSAGDG